MRRLLLAALASLALAAPAAGQKSASPVQIDSITRAGHHFLELYHQTRNLADAREARRMFTSVLRKQRGHAAAHLGLGLTYAAVELQQLDPLGFNDVTRVTNNTMAVRHLLEAVKRGGDVAVAARALRMVAVREYKKDRFAEIWKVLESVAMSSDAASVALAELYIDYYREDSAIPLLTRAASPAAVRLLGVAHLLRPGSAERGAQDYLRGLAEADSALLDSYKADARWLADPAEAAMWEGLSSAELRTHLKRFWERRAIVSAVSVPVRLSTHFKRVQAAHDRFNFYDQRPAIGAMPGKSISMGIENRAYHVDDRAFVFVRYGEPDDIIRTAGIDYWNESWVYNRLSDRPVTFDFFLPPIGPAVRYWTLIYDVPRCTGNSILPYSHSWLRDRARVDHRYASILQHCSARRRDAAAVEAIALPMIAEKMRFLTTAVVRDNAVPATSRNIPLLTDVVQFRDSPHSSSITAVIAWPLDALLATAAGAAHTYRLKATFFVADTLRGHVARRDTTLQLQVASKNAGSSARVHMTISAPPADHALYRIILEDLNDRSVTTAVGDSINVRSFSANALQLSDIAVAATRDGGTWVRAGHRLSLIPRDALQANFRIYYEVYNVPIRSTYTTRLTFVPVGDALAKLVARLQGKSTVSLEFSGSNQGSATTVSELRAIGTELPSGDYILRLAVTAGGETVFRERPIRIP